MKTQVTNISSTAIIYSAARPCEVFLEVKDTGHPNKLVHGQLCPIGGNWIGEAAKLDKNPRATLCRELGEELSFERPRRNSLELAEMGMADLKEFDPALAPRVAHSEVEVMELSRLKDVMFKSAQSFAAYINTVSMAALDQADPNNKKDGFSTLAIYWRIPLENNDWQSLCALQRKFGNLSNESITLVTSLDEILKRDAKFAFGHDGAFRNHFFGSGYLRGRSLPRVPGVESREQSLVPGDYGDYLHFYDVAKKPI